MLNSIYMVLALLYIKHWLIDFVNQNAEELANKGRYGNAHGLMHSIKHGVATFLVFWYMLNWQGAVILGFIDFVIHYHVDWAKININKNQCQTIDPNQYPMLRDRQAHVGQTKVAHG